MGCLVRPRMASSCLQVHVTKAFPPKPESASSRGMSVGQISNFSSLSDDTFAVSHIGEDSSGRMLTSAAFKANFPQDGVGKRTEAKVTQHQCSQQSHMHTRCCQIILSLVRPLLCSFFRAAALTAVCSISFGLIAALIKSELRCERIWILPRING